MSPAQFAEELIEAFTQWAGTRRGGEDGAAALARQYLDDPSFAADLTVTLARQVHHALGGRDAETIPDGEVHPDAIRDAAFAWADRTAKARAAECGCRAGCDRCQLPSREHDLRQVTEIDIRLARAAVPAGDRAVTWNPEAGTWIVTVTGGQWTILPPDGDRPFRATRGDGKEYTLLSGSPGEAARDFLTILDRDPDRATPETPAVSRGGQLQAGWTITHPHAAAIAALRQAARADSHLSDVARANPLDRFAPVFTRWAADHVADAVLSGGGLTPFAAQYLDDPSFAADLAATLARQAYQDLGGQDLGAGDALEDPDPAAVQAAAGWAGRIRQDRARDCGCGTGCPDCAVPDGDPALAQAAAADIHLARAGVPFTHRNISWPAGSDRCHLTVTGPGTMFTRSPGSPSEPALESAPGDPRAPIDLWHAGRGGDDDETLLVTRGGDPMFAEMLPADPADAAAALIAMIIEHTGAFPGPPAAGPAQPEPYQDATAYFAGLDAAVAARREWQATATAAWAGKLTDHQVSGSRLHDIRGAARHVTYRFYDMTLTFADDPGEDLAHAAALARNAADACADLQNALRDGDYRDPADRDTVARLAAAAAAHAGRIEATRDAGLAAALAAAISEAAAARAAGQQGDRPAATAADPAPDDPAASPVPVPAPAPRQPPGSASSTVTAAPPSTAPAATTPPCTRFSTPPISRSPDVRASGTCPARGASTCATRKSRSSPANWDSWAGRSP